MRGALRRATPAPSSALSALCDEHGLALIEDAAHAPSATPVRRRKLGTFGLAGCFWFFSNKILSCGEGGLLATDDDAVAATARAPALARDDQRARGIATAATAGYDVAASASTTGSTSRAPRCCSARLGGLEDGHRRRRELVHRYRELLADVRRPVVPYSDEEVDTAPAT